MEHLDIELVRLENKSGFKLKSEPGSRPVVADFSSTVLQRYIEDSFKRRPILLKAIFGAKYQGETLKVFDFCSGFGAEAFLMAMHGLKVTSTEIHSEISKLVQETWEQEKSTGWVAERSPDLRFENGEGGEWLKEHAQKFDVIYMDPMFEKLKSSAKSPIEMQVLQRLHQDVVVPTLQESFDLAIQYAPKVVIKAARKGPALVNRNPSYQLLGKTIRFDVYQGSISSY